MNNLPQTNNSKISTIRNSFYNGMINFKIYIKNLSELYEESLTLKGMIRLIDPTGITGEVISTLGRKLEYLERKRIDSYLNDLQIKIDNLELAKLDKDFVNSDEFVEIFFRILDKIRREYRNEKIKYFSNIMLNYCRYEYSKDFYKEGIIDRISSYSIEHILVLQKAYQLHINNNTKGKSIDFESNESFGMLTYVAEICISTLYSDGFLERGSFGGYFVSEYGIKCVELIQQQ